MANYIDFSRTENVREHIKRAADFAAREIREVLAIQHSWGFSSSCEPCLASPIEAIFEVWWAAVSIVDLSKLLDRANLVRQEWIEVDQKRYRADFVFNPDSGHPLVRQAINLGVILPKIAIELDGHEFHERTKEQVAVRNSRDRALQTAGWLVLHFSGSEIHRDPIKCVKAVEELVMNEYGQLEEKVFYALQRLESKRTQQLPTDATDT